MGEIEFGGFRQQSRVSFIGRHRSGAAALLGLLTAGCATGYVPPRVLPPAQWMGASGFSPDGPPQVHSGLLREGDALVSMPLSFVRTGILADAVQATDAFGGTMILPKGAKAYAINYTLVSQSGYGPRASLQTKVDPIEWCVIAPNGFNGKKTESQTTCIFWETPERARYMQDYSSGGFQFAPMIEIGGATGTPGPVPVIDEQPVDFGVQVRRELRILKIIDHGVFVGHAISDGKHARAFDQHLVRWPSIGEAVVYSGFRLKRADSDATAVEVTPVATPGA